MIHDLSRDVLHTTGDASADKGNNLITSMSDTKDSAGTTLSGKGHGSEVFQHIFWYNEPL